MKLMKGNVNAKNMMNKEFQYNQEQSHPILDQNIESISSVMNRKQNLTGQQNINCLDQSRLKCWKRQKTLKHREIQHCEEL
jgi:hypothetical protein